MQKKKKIGLKLTIFLAILMFLIIPLFSSPVAAVVKFDKVAALTDNTSSGPAVSVVTTQPGTIAPGTYWRTDDGSGTFTVYCDCYCIDRNGGGTGSDHYIELNVFRVSTSTLYATNYLITLNPNTQNGYPVQISCSAPYSTGAPVEQFTVYVYAYCEDLQTQQAAWNTWYWTVWV